MFAAVTAVAGDARVGCVPCDCAEFVRSYLYSYSVQLRQVDYFVWRLLIFLVDGDRDVDFIVVAAADVSAHTS
jgi:hypothetical protein